MGAAEIRRRRILTYFNDAAADRASSGKMLEQSFAVAATDRARQLRQIFVKRAEHFQHCVLVGEKYVAPHGRIGRGNASKIAKAAGGKLEHFGRGHFSEF